MATHEIRVGMNASGLTFTDPSGNNAEEVTGHLFQTFRWCTAYPKLELKFDHHPFIMAPTPIVNTTGDLVCGPSKIVFNMVKTEYEYKARLTIDSHGTIKPKDPKVIIDGSLFSSALAVSLVLAVAYMVYRQLARRGVR